MIFSVNKMTTCCDNMMAAYHDLVSLSPRLRVPHHNSTCVSMESSANANEELCSLCVILSQFYNCLGCSALDGDVYSITIVCSLSRSGQAT